MAGYNIEELKKDSIESREKSLTLWEQIEKRLDSSKQKIERWLNTIFEIYKDSQELLKSAFDKFTSNLSQEEKQGFENIIKESEEKLKALAWENNEIKDKLNDCDNILNWDLMKKFWDLSTSEIWENVNPEQDFWEIVIASASWNILTITKIKKDVQVKITEIIANSKTWESSMESIKRMILENWWEIILNSYTIIDWKIKTA